MKWENPPSKTTLMSIKPLLASARCGGEIADVLKELTRALVCEEEWSRQIEREVNEERKPSARQD